MTTVCRFNSLEAVVRLFYVPLDVVLMANDKTSVGSFCIGRMSKIRSGGNVFDDIAVVPRLKLPLNRKCVRLLGEVD